MRADDPSHSPFLCELPRPAWQAGLLRPPGAVILSGLSLGLALLTATPLPLRADDAPPPSIETLAHRRDQPPRKVVVGSVVCGFDEIFDAPLERRLQRMDEFLDGMEALTRAQYPGKRLDLAVLMEWFISRPGKTLDQMAVRYAEVSERIASSARRHGCYMVVPMVLREEGEPARYSNASCLFDRQGRLLGIYRKVHPTMDNEETSITPGREFPVFDCDFGRLGIQVCYDVMFPDGWQALAKKGAELVAFPSETSVTSGPAMYALQHRFYIVSAVPKYHAAVYNPVGMIEAEATDEGVMVHQIDLAYAVAGPADQGVGLKAKFGDKLGMNYYQGENVGIFWSNDPAMTIGQMLKGQNCPDPRDEAEESRIMQDRKRGGPPEAP
jgi:predicted amidohydrolase